MRTRTRLIPLPSQMRSFRCSNSPERPLDANFVYGFDVPQAKTYADTRLAYYGQIQDEDSPGTRRIKSVIHRKDTPCVITRDTCQLTYPVGYPIATVNYDAYHFMYKPSFPAANLAKWGEVLDDLATLVSGKVKHAAALPVTLLELPKTLQMIRNPFKLMEKDWRRRAEQKTALQCMRGNARTASGIWLEAFYGWGSFKRDVEVIAKATHAFLKSDAVKTLKEYEHSRYSIAIWENTKNGYVYPWVTAAAWQYSRDSDYLEWHDHSDYRRVAFRVVDCHTKTKYMIGCHSVKDACRRISTAERLLQFGGLHSWQDVRDTIWEVVPYSFVIDWFIDTRGMWAPLNKWNLQRAGCYDFVHSMSTEVTYQAEFLHAPGYVLRNSNGPWAGVTPFSGPKKVVGRSISGGKSLMYIRTPGLPPSAPIDAKFLSHGLKRIECLNGAALLLQKL